MNKVEDITKVNFGLGMEDDSGELIMTAHSKNMDSQENPQTYFLKRDIQGIWYSTSSVSWIPNGICSNSENDSIIVGHPAGTCLEINSEKHSFSTVHPDEEMADVRMSELIFLKRIGDKVYGGGTNRYLYEYERGSWKEISVNQMQGEPMPSCFENVTGFSGEELYAFGWGGVVWTNKDNTWRQVGTPTKYMLYSGDVLDDTVYIAGQLGVILKGRGDTFKQLDTSHIPDHDVYDVCTFKDAVYLSTIRNILRIKDGKIEIFKERTDEFKTYRLFVGLTGLYSVSDGFLAKYDGNDWEILTNH